MENVVSSFKEMPVSINLESDTGVGNLDEILRLDDDQFHDMALDQGWSDGLPVVTPTYQRVSSFIDSINVNPATCVAGIPPANGKATHEKLIVNAVMAGCMPQHFPIIKAAVQALVHPDFKLDYTQVTTSPVSTMVVVNGPITDTCGMNSSTNALGPGNRANACIGRALRLILQNIGGAVPGKVDMATLGQPLKYTFCFAENESASPWGPIAEQFGINRGKDAVTVVPAAGIFEIRDSVSESASELLQTLAESMTPIGIVGPSGKAAIDGVVTIVLAPEHAHILAYGGLNRVQVQEELWQRAQIDVGRLSESNRQALGATRKAKGLLSDFNHLPITTSYQNILLIVAGGAGRKSCFVPGWGASLAVTVAVGMES